MTDPRPRAGSAPAPGSSGRPDQPDARRGQQGPSSASADPGPRPPGPAPASAWLRGCDRRQRPPGSAAARPSRSRRRRSSARARARSPPSAPRPAAAAPTAAWRWRRSRWTGRPPAPGRSARPRTGPCAHRCSWSPRSSAVELGREESRRALQDLVGTPQLPVLPLELGDAPTLLGRHARSLAAVDLRLLDPVAQRLRPDPQLAGHPGDHAEALATLGDRLSYHADSPLTQLGRVSALARVGLTLRGDLRCRHTTPSFPRNGVSIEPGAVQHMFATRTWEWRWGSLARDVRCRKTAATKALVSTWSTPSRPRRPFAAAASK